MTDMYEVIIVGAGWCGLIAAKTYLQTKPSARILIVDDASTVGGTWCKERLYPHLVAEAHYGLFEFSDIPMPSDDPGVDSHGLITGQAVHNYLSMYATHFNLDKHIRFNTKISKATRVSPHWHLSISGENEILISEKLIVATGLTSKPFIPSIPNHGFKGEILHTKELGKPQTIAKISFPNIQTVAVYGGSKSSFDAVYMLLKTGKTVEWIIRPGKGGPSMMTPIKILGNPSFHLSNTRFMDLWSPSIFSFSEGKKPFGTIKSFLHSPGINQFVSGPLVKGFWRGMTFLLQGEAQYSKSENSKKLKPCLGLDSLFWSPATLGVMTHPELWKEIHESKRVKVRQGTIERFEGDNLVVLDNGERVSADMVILATGWNPPSGHFIFSDEDALRFGLPSANSFSNEKKAKWEGLRSEQDERVKKELPLLSESPNHGRKDVTPRVEDDFHLYRFVVPAEADPEVERSLAYIGFLRTAGAPIVYEAQALWAAAYLQGRLDVPGPEERARDTAKAVAWARRRYLCGYKVPFALFDFMSYVDVLYNDLGVNSRRKGNFLSELIGLYTPGDFKGVVREWLENQKVDGHENPQSWAGFILVLMIFSVVMSVFASFTLIDLDRF
ncbi:cofactor FMO1 enzyme is FAD [Podospora fimiseda]|uniref:Cofactor FMO1 enzyme is FAD n=1 Tax=Podospora fimiseda TaxID=252190 RepID=A0AAN6YPU0_9PEZI|nr:cofactor FMO1 enzyme is FAD [Podospora fimiseda]